MKHWIIAGLLPVSLAIAIVPTSLIMLEIPAIAAPQKAKKTSKPASNKAWYTITGQGFSIQMPSKPTVDSEKQTIEGHTFTVTTYAIHNPNRTGNFFSIRTLPFSLDATDPDIEKFMDLFVKQSIESHSSKQISQRSLSLNGYPVREVTLQEGPTIAKLRIFIVKHRVFTVLAAGDRQQLNAGSLDKFFQSFKLTQ